MQTNLPSLQILNHGVLHTGTNCPRMLAQVSLPSSGAGLPAYYVIAMSEASSNLSRYDGIRYGVRREVCLRWSASVAPEYY